MCSKSSTFCCCNKVHPPKKPFNQAHSDSVPNIRQINIHAVNFRQLIYNLRVRHIIHSEHPICMNKQITFSTPRYAFIYFLQCSNAGRQRTHVTNVTSSTSRLCRTSSTLSRASERTAVVTVKNFFYLLAPFECIAFGVFKVICPIRLQKTSFTNMSIISRLYGQIC